MDKADPKNKLPQEGTSAAGGTGESLTRALDMSSSSTIVRALGRPSYSGEGQGSPNMKTRNKQTHTLAHTHPHTPKSAASSEDTPRRTDEAAGDNGINPFIRGGAVQRSPPTKSVERAADVTEMPQEATTESLYSAPVTEVAKTVWLTKTHERRGSLGSENLLTAYRTKSGFTGKRMRNEEDDGNDTQAAIMNAIARLTKITAGLVKIVSENANTKLEIKTGVRDLKGNLEHLNKITKDWEECPRKTTKTRAISKHTKEIGTQTEDNKNQNNKENEIISMKEIGTQTEGIADGYQSDTGNGKKEQRTETNLKDKIESCNDLKGLEEIIDLEWPEEAFKMVKIEKGNPLAMDKNWDIAVIAKPKEKGEDKPKGIRKILRKAYPEALELLDKNKSSTVEYTVRTSKSSKKGLAESERWIYVIPSTDAAEGTKQVEILYNKIQELTKILEEHDRKKKLVVVADKEVNKNYLRKILERLLSKFGVEIKLLVESVIQTADRNDMKDRRTETLMVKGEGSYADILKKMKTCVTAADMKSIGVSVKSVRKASNGKMMMKVTGNAEALKDKLLSVAECTEVRLGKDVIFHITGMEEDVNAEELKAAVETELSVPIQVKSIRPTQYGSKTTTISMSPHSARKLTSVNFVTVGWAKCRMRKRVYIEKCYRCWETGHKASKCNGPNRANLCRSCGSVGHKAVNCTAKPSCPLCETKGHKAATTGCPKFRSAINAAGQPRQRDRPRTTTKETLHED